MSIFSKIKGAKKAANDHKQAQHGAAPETVDKPIPYKHVPTHAAIDAMAGAPASYREADRAEIKATNEKRRSMLAQSSSSGVSSPLHRNSSYGSTSNYSYSRPMPSRVEARRSYGAHGGYYNNGLQVGHQPFSPSPLASKGPSPTGSLNESSSSSSSHLVEMQYAAPVSDVIHFPQTAPAPAPTSHGMATTYSPPAPKRFEQTMLETIHSSPTRKLGEAPLLSQPPATSTKPAVAPTPVQAKKRSWAFGKRNSHGPAIAAH